MEKLGACAWLLLGASLSLAGCSSSSDQSGPTNNGSRAELPTSSGDNSGDFGLAPSMGTSTGTAPGTGASSGPADDPAPGTGVPSSAPSTGTSLPSTSSGTAPLPQAGQLTAGAWDDNRNFDRFSQYRADLAQQQLPGIPPITTADYAAANQTFSAAPGAKAQLDVAFVLDTTGSMQDELSYLQSEFISIAKSIADKYPDAEERYSLMLYRDHSDEYLTRTFDFSDDANAFEKNLAAQSAAGGGDIPEAPDVALTQAEALSWRTDAATARLAFWVADAPHHEADAGTMRDAFLALQAKGIHVYPVAASGTDELLEVTMRSAAELTGGRYLFLTNDSGIGNDHKEPTIPCYFVTLLDQAILRMVDIEMTGVYREPDPADIIRTGGNPMDGACQLDSGEIVLVF
ncbi:MAG TPA: VWA domain-containing protein [Polyangiaceae bacterium]